MSDLHQQAFDAPWSQKSFETLLNLPTTVGWTFEMSERGIGFLVIQISDKEAEILTFQMASEFQGQGLGSHLLSKGLENLKAMKVDRVYLEVAVSRQPAQKIYQRQGFVITGRRPKYYKTLEGREDALLMSLNLGPYD